MERHVPELHHWVGNDNGAAPKVRCAIFDVVSWFPGVLQQLWIDVSVRCPHAERYNESASKPGVAVPRDLVATAVAVGQCSVHSVGRWRTQLERVLLTAQADTYIRALGSRVAERPAAEHPLRLAE